jgi:hypothetical protein
MKTPMSIRLILSNTNSWVSVPIPNGLDPLWSESDILHYAAMFVGAQERGFSDARSEQLAEALVNRRLYPGIVYEKTLQSDLEFLQS